MCEDNSLLATLMNKISRLVKKIPQLNVTFALLFYRWSLQQPFLLIHRVFFSF